MNIVRELMARHKRGERVGITSVCSAHPLVIEATFAHALRRDAPAVLIEATSNQVNQDGGYTGMMPADFRVFVEGIAERLGFPLDRLVLGGDHLGPAQLGRQGLEPQGRGMLVLLVHDSSLTPPREENDRCHAGPAPPARAASVRAC